MISDEMCISWWSGPGWRAPACWNAHSSDLELSSEDLLFPIASWQLVHHIQCEITHLSITLEQFAESFIWTNRILRPERVFLNHSYDYDGL